MRTLYPNPDAVETVPMPRHDLIPSHTVTALPSPVLLGNPYPSPPPPVTSPKLPQRVTHPAPTSLTHRNHSSTATPNPNPNPNPALSPYYP